MQKKMVLAKIYKSLGLTDKDSNGNRIAVNDQNRSIWEEWKIRFSGVNTLADPASF